MEHVLHCPLCASSDKKTAYHITRNASDFTVSRCSTCGHLFMDPQPDAAGVQSMYDAGYFDGSASFSYTDERKNKKGFQAVARARVRYLLRMLSRKTGTGLEFLDIGCSFGSLLDAAREAGFGTTGVDISPYAVGYVQNQGHLALEGMPETVVLEPDRYRAVSMVEVIEHLTDPKTALRNLFAALQPGGVLLVQTANMAGRQAIRAGADYHYFLPGHLQYFSRRRLAELLAECGFSGIRTHYPCEFGLLPKLKKSRGEFTRFRDTLRWVRITTYHLKSKFHLKEFALTSGMVLTARKPDAPANS